MKILFNADGKAQGTATDAYEGPDAWGHIAESEFHVDALDQYTLENGVVVLVPTSKITRLAFRNRFAQSEKVMLELASQHDPAAPLPARQQAAALRAYLADMAAAAYIDLCQADTRAGVQFLEAAAVLVPGRAREILDTPVLSEERHP